MFTVNPFKEDDYTVGNMFHRHYHSLREPSDIMDFLEKKL